MKKLILAFLLLSLSLASFSQTSRLEKAKIAIREEFKKTMNDYNSYSPVSYGSIDSLFTSPFDSEKIANQLEVTVSTQTKAGLSNLPITYDISDQLAEMEKDPDKYKPEAILYWRLYKLQQEVLFAMLNNFEPEFIGWKLQHKYRAKNAYNATMLYSKEIHLDKSANKVIAINDIDE